MGNVHVLVTTSPSLNIQGKRVDRLLLIQFCESLALSQSAQVSAMNSGVVAWVSSFPCEQERWSAIIREGRCKIQNVVFTILRAQIGVGTSVQGIAVPLRPQNHRRFGDGGNLEELPEQVPARCGYFIVR